ncbi:hypothetical protein SAMN02745133_02259 [Desulforamulus putei DSM 12395]|uniref:Uncharacterized protein n=1 Tax=Desulforamulus putei DSM 12395 TaxID=1121429 RepID=A0A1M5AET8_9FIRM|nr:hypothetical protein [Desulforamulus putei]SHF28798.1 hypothetical protein SAMN02745133_02259 [Desulforamulus putei DSM 12395]
MDQNHFRALDSQSPFTLFLILILLILGTEQEVERYFDNAKTFILETKRSLESIRGGFENMHANMLSFHSHLMELQQKK